MDQTKNTGQGVYPVPNPEYDVISMLHNKLQAIEAYQKYLKDARGDQELNQLIQECMKTDQQLAERLHQALHRIHGKEKAVGR